MKTNIFKGLRDFLILWSSQAVSTLGTAMTNFALIIWVYEQKSTASSLTLLSLFSFLPSILFCFIAGTIADRWDKKRIMLVADFVAALGTLSVLILFTNSLLQVWHLYIINFMLSFMNAFQKPASYVATSLLTPKEQYVRVSALYAFSDSLVVIVAPALGSVLLAVGGLKVVLLLDLASFAVASLTLLFFVKIPTVIGQKEKTEESFLSSCMAGINFLREHSTLLRLILFFAFINFIAKMGSYGMMPAIVLGRTGGNEYALGIVEAAVGIGTLVGSIFVSLMKPTKSRIKTIFITCGISFALGDVGQGLSRIMPLWVASAFTSNVPMALLNANLTAIMRTNIPIEMHGRVFSARDTIQFSTIPIGLFLGGILADYVFEPLMSTPSTFQHFLSFFVGEGTGSGIALMFVIVGVIGTFSSFFCLKNKNYKELDRT